MINDYVDTGIVQALNQSVQDVYYIILHRKLKVNEIAKKSRYSSRTVRHAIKTLSNLNLIVQIPDMKDLRSHYYTTTEI